MRSRSRSRRRPWSRCSARRPGQTSRPPVASAGAVIVVEASRLPGSGALTLNGGVWYRIHVTLQSRDRLRTARHRAWPSPPRPVGWCGPARPRRFLISYTERTRIERRTPCSTAQHCGRSTSSWPTVIGAPRSPPSPRNTSTRSLGRLRQPPRAQDRRRTVADRGRPLSRVDTVSAPRGARRGADCDGQGRPGCQRLARSRKPPGCDTRLRAVHGRQSHGSRDRGSTARHAARGAGGE